jgi:NADPH:quinone reductase-like Zn-dependent oxidoreductase
MNAILLHEHGGPEKLQIGQFETPSPGPDEALIEIKAAAVNRLDIFVREGWPGINLEYPHILGADAAGVVAEVGAGVELEVGQRVAVNPTTSCGACEWCLAGQDNLCRSQGLLGETRRGTYAEYVALPARNLLPLPDHVPFEEAAAASLVFLTAWHSLITRGGLRPGETVLIVGAGGGANTAYLQIAKLSGAKVYVVGSSDDKLAKAEALGADVLINRDKEDWSKAVYNLTGRRGVDVVVDNVGQATWFSSIRALRRGGRMLVVGNTSGPKTELDIRYIFGKQISIVGSTMGTHSDFRRVMGLIFEGKLKPVIDRVLPLEQAEDAHRALESGQVFGKVVLTP